MLVGLASSVGCVTDDDKKQWNRALGDLRGDNIKGIAPLEKKSSSD